MDKKIKHRQGRKDNLSGYLITSMPPRVFIGFSSNEKLLDLPGPLKFYPTMEKFFQAKTDRSRRLSRELDYGVRWSLSGMNLPMRLTYMHQTGELYLAWRYHDQDQVLVFTKIEANNEELLEKIIAGWADSCMKTDSIDWLLCKLQDYFKTKSLENTSSIGKHPVLIRQNEGILPSLKKRVE